MLGAARGAGGYRSPAPTPDVIASISPSYLVWSTTNGSYTTPFFSANVSNGVGPYTYNWEIDNGAVVDPSSEKTKFIISGYNRTIFATATLTVTDTGDSNKKSISGASIVVSFEPSNRGILR